jgi:predicted GNAT family acetyltransferase
MATYLSSASGGVYLALDDENQLVATAIVDLVRPHEVYVSGVRVRPDMQGSSIGQEFAEFQVQEAKSMGATIIRALVGSGNELSSKILQEHLGFQVVEEWVVGSVEGFDAPPYPDGQAGPAWAVDRDRLLAFLNQFSDDLWAGKDAWTPHRLTFDDVWHGVEHGSAVVAPQDAEQALDTLALFRITDDAMHVNYLRSMGQHLKSLLQYLWVESRAWGVKRMHFGLPRHAAEKLIEVAGLPLAREWHGVVLEKHVGLTSTSLV